MTAVRIDHDTRMSLRPHKGAELLEEVPLWGQWSVLGMSIGLNVTFVLLFVRGIIVSRAQLDQVQKTADMFQLAWSNTQKDGAEMKQMLLDVSVGMKTMAKVIEALPKPASSPGQESDDLSTS